MNFSELHIPREEFEIRTSRSGGPGGQHVNKVETKVEIRFHLASAHWLPVGVRNRLQSQHSNKVNKEGFFILSSEQSRSQKTNLEDCFKKLSSLIEAAWKPPKKRIKTKTPRSAKEKRLKAKKKNSDNKKMRGKVKFE